MVVIVSNTFIQNGILQYSLFSTGNILFWFLMLVMVFIYVMTKDIFTTLMIGMGAVLIFLADTISWQKDIQILIFFIAVYVIYNKFVIK